MSHNDRRSPGKMQAIRRAARTVAAVVRECNYASSRLRDARIFPDFRAESGDRAPDTYNEFLWRSPVALWREPPARRRAVGACPHR
jgi:hypothetical protein